MRKAVIAGNWKMHMTCAETRVFAAVFRPLIADLPNDREVVIAPPFTSIPTLCRHLEGAGVQIAGQNVHWEDQGAYTGMISAPMLLEQGGDCHLLSILKSLWPTLLGTRRGLPL